jgi:hypothetical protein
VSAPGSTSHRVLPSGDRRASSGLTVGAFNGVLWSRLSEPSAVIE